MLLTKKSADVAMMLSHFAITDSQKLRYSWRKKSEQCNHHHQHFLSFIFLFFACWQNSDLFWDLRGKKIPYMVTLGTPTDPQLYLEQEKHNFEYQNEQKIGAASPFQNKLKHPSSTSQTTWGIAKQLVTVLSTGGGASASYRILLEVSHHLLWTPSGLCARKVHL